MRNHNTTLNTIFMTFKHSLSNKILAYFTPSSMKGIFSLSFIWHFLQETRRKSRKQVKITWLSKSLKFLKIHWRHRILMPDSRMASMLQNTDDYYSLESSQVKKVIISNKESSWGQKESVTNYTAARPGIRLLEAAAASALCCCCSSIKLERRL